MTNEDSSDEEWVNSAWSSEAKSPIQSNLDMADVNLITHWAVKLRFKKEGEDKIGTGFFIKLPSDFKDYHLILTAAHNFTNVQGARTTDLQVTFGIPGVDVMKIEDSDWSNVFISKTYVGNGKPETDYGAIRIPKAKYKFNVMGFGFSMKLAYEEMFKGKINVTGWQKIDKGGDEALYTSSDVCKGCYPNRVEYASNTLPGMSGSAVYIEYKGTYAAIAIHNNAAEKKGSDRRRGVRLTPELLCEVFAWVGQKIVFNDVEICAKDTRLGRNQAKGATLPKLGLFLSFKDDFGFGRVRLRSGTKFDVMPAEITAKLGSTDLYAMSVTRTGQGPREWVVFNPKSTTKTVSLSETMVDNCLFNFKMDSKNGWFKIVSAQYQLQIQGLEIDETEEEMESSEVSWVPWPKGDLKLFTNFVFKT